MKCWTILALAGVIITPLSAMAATFSDTEFADADWTAAFEIVDQTSNDTGAFTGAQASPGGNPGNYRQVSNFMNDATPTGNRIAGGHLKIGAVYDPGVAGALSSITFSFDLIGLSGPAGAMGAGFLIEQGGKYFGQGVPQAVNGAGWQSRGNTGQVASDFVAFDGISTLDFSASGGALTFGFYSSNGTRGESLNIGGVDNWSVTLAEAPDAVVPLPATLPFVLSAIAGLALMNRRRSWSERATSGRTNLVA